MMLVVASINDWSKSVSASSTTRNLTPLNWILSGKVVGRMRQYVKAKLRNVTKIEDIVLECN